KMRCAKYNKFFMNLANKMNIEIVELLEEGPLNVKNITQRTQREQSAVSHSLRKLADCNIVKVQKKGRERFYHLNTEFIFAMYDLLDKHAEKYCGVCDEHHTLSSKRRESINEGV
ncbi:MAG: metalloregulator ArsR/SmtB family transcription factor, partial [Candidatus Woesearchaeota archaeon]